MRVSQIFIPTPSAPSVLYIEHTQHIFAVLMLGRTSSGIALLGVGRESTGLFHDGRAVWGWVGDFRPRHFRARLGGTSDHDHNAFPYLRIVMGAWQKCICHEIGWYQLAYKFCHFSYRGHVGLGER